jgi:Pyruvate/2-oxoacid:ferredoxin oxidoreductase delta subunit
MCNFCTQHGEGKKWYLNIENYLEERLSDEQKLTTRGQHENVEHGAAEFWATANAADNPEERVRLFFEEMKKKEWGQVIPMEDVEKIFDMSLNIVRSPCVCRVALRGAKEYRACFKVVASPSQFWKDMFDELPDMSRDMDVVSCEEAKKDFRKFDEGGLVHTVWSYGAPFVGALCNCTPMDCLGMKGMAYGGHRPFYKAEYVAVIDAENCIGCRDCMSFCHFGAIRYSSTSEKCVISQFQCFGCGLCREACPQDSISLLDRNEIPGLKNEW